MLLFRPDLEDDKLQSAVEKVTRAIVNAGGALTKVSPWGKRRLAYDIKHFREASYFLIHFDIAPAEVRGIERGILITEEILRHLVTVLEEKALGRADDDSLIAEVPIPDAIDEVDDTQADGLAAGIDEDGVAAGACGRPAGGAAGLPRPAGCAGGAARRAARAPSSSSSRPSRPCA